MKYKHIFFDLDHTLWDFETNSAETLEEIYYSWSLGNHGISSHQFVSSFLKINTALWNAFDTGQLQHSYIRENRFRLVFDELGIMPGHNYLEMGEAYLNSLPTKKNLLDGAVEVLEYLTKAGYKLHIITNGFDEIQSRKINSSGINHYFEFVITFENANAKKPDPQIFMYALNLTNAENRECIMVGDNWTADILGAQSAGLDTIYYNPGGALPDGKPTYTIQHLEELLQIL